MCLIFTHLHVHSDASDGLATPEQLVREAKRLGYTSLALTDHNTLSGHSAFTRAAHEAGMHAIYGCEVRAYTPYGSGHLLVLAPGHPLAHPSAFARLHEVLGLPFPPSARELSWDGFYVTSACLGGEVAAALRRGDYWNARDVARHYQRLFGDHYYLEVQPSFGGLLPMVVALAHDLGIPVIGTNDVHYLTNRDALEAEPAVIGRMNLDLASEAQLRRRNALSSWRYAMDGAARLAEQLTQQAAYA